MGDPLTGRNDDHDESPCWVSAPRYQQQIYAERFVNPISSRLHNLLLDRAKILLMQGVSTIRPIGTYADYEDTTADVS